MLFYRACILVFIMLMPGLLDAGAMDVHGRIKPDTTAGQVFIRTLSSRATVFAGEAFIVKYQLCSAIDVIDPQTTVDLKFEHCYQQQYPVSDRFSTEVIKGKAYKIITLKQYLIIASEPGSVVLPGFKMNIKMNTPSNDFFGQEKLAAKTISCADAMVKVNPLPASKDAKLFNGAVGSFRTVYTYKKSPGMSNLLVFQLHVEGRGNTKTAGFNNPVLSRGLEIYNAATTRHDTLSDDGLVTQLDYTFQIVSTYRGNFTIPPLVFSYFDAREGKYVKFATQPYRWTVNTGPVLASLRADDEKANSGLFTKNNLDEEAGLYSLSQVYFILVVIALIILFYSFNTLRVNALLRRFLFILKSKRIKRRALKSVRELSAASHGMNDKVFSKQVTAIFYRFVRERNESLAKLPALSFDNALFRKTVPPELYTEIAAFLNLQQRILFCPAPMLDNSRLNSCDQLTAVINNLTKHWDA